jgi:alkanesulfonate monooxygenase SsuD/methylene tetrahydromethanopterin reductase-like flavin-dependent oxidoreductase (luciferase family)
MTTSTDLSTDRPALSLVATAGKRQTILDLAVEAERRGFAGLALPSLGGTMGLAVSIAHLTSTIPYWTSIQPIYLATAAETAATAGLLQELTGGRFRLGLGVSHEPVTRRLGVETGRPLADMRAYVGALHEAERGSGPLPPVYLATMRDKMLGLAAEIADGAVWANACRSAMGDQLGRVPEASRESFFRANMIPTVIDDDHEAAAAINRRTMTGYVSLPNYRNYWKQVGYAEEMTAIEAALDAGERDRLPSLMSDRWLADCTLFGSANEVRDGIEAWRATGVVPIAVMSSTSGGQAKAIGELFAAYE